MRTIKFRGKRVGDLEWLVGDLIHTEQDDPEQVSMNYWDEVDGWMNYPVHHDTVGQFTGVLDKNGEEIYEGDIVEMWQGEAHHRTGIVCFVEGKYCYVVGRGVYSFFPNDEDIDELVTVIGNIHDNPELLEE